MKLHDFLQTAQQTGHARFKLASAGRGHELQRGELATATADHIEALCRDDAAPLVRDALHEYVLTVESEDGAKFSRFTVRVHGGAGGAQDEHRVDPMQTNTPAAVVGHLARLVVDQQKHFTALAMKMLDRDIEETRELAKLRRAQARRGEFEIQAKVLELTAQEQAEQRARTQELWSQAFQLAQPIVGRLMMSMKLPASGEATALAHLRASFSEAQLIEMSGLLGPARFGRFMALESPEKVAALFIEEVPPPIAQRILALMTDGQRALITAALKAEMERRAKAAPTPATPTNGVAS